MPFDDDYYEEDGFIRNVDIIFGTYANFLVEDNEFLLELNNEGIESFINVLDRLLFKTNNYARLTGFQYTDSYTLSAECFFEENSDDLDITKFENDDPNIYYKDLGPYPYGGEKQIGIEMNYDSLVKFKEKLKNEINATGRKITFIVIDKDSKKEKKLIIENVDKVSPRKQEEYRY